MPKPTDDIVALKARLREQMRARRAAIPAAERAAAATAVADLIEADGLIPLAATVGAFMPIGEEINPLVLCARLRAKGHPIALPRMVGKGKPVDFHIHAPGDPLETKIWGIREPLPSAPRVVPDAFLVPLLAFDGAGYRLGYGGGFYDRTLQMARKIKKIVTIGLAFDLQRVDAVPRLDYDERLDWIVTPSGICRSAS